MAGIPEGQLTCAIPSGIAHDQGVDPNKLRPIQIGEFVRKYVSRRLLTLSEGEIAAFMTAMRARKEELRPWQPSTSSCSMNGLQDPWQLRWPESQLTKKLFRNDCMEYNEELSRQPSPDTQQ